MLHNKIVCLICLRNCGTMESSKIDKLKTAHALMNNHTEKTLTCETY